MEIGGQPAGRIEMTVRIVFLFSFLSRVFLSSRAPGAFLFSLDDDDEKFLDHFFPINPAGKKGRRRRRFVFCSILARALTTSGGPLLLSSFVNDNENNTNNVQIIKAPKGRVPENRGKLPSVMHRGTRVWVQAIAVSPGDSRVHVPRRRLYQPKRHRG